MSYIRPQLGADIEMDAVDANNLNDVAEACKADPTASICAKLGPQPNVGGALAQTGANIANSIAAPLASLFSVFGAPAAKNTAVAKKSSLLPLAVGAALVAMFIMNKKKRSK